MNIRKLGTIIFALIFSLAWVNSSQSATIAFPTGGGTGTSTKPLAGQVLVGNAAGTYSVVNTSTLGFVAVESDPIWSAFLLNPIFSNLTSTNFFATSSRIINSVTTNATTTNLYVSGSLNLPNNSITDAMVVDTITASNYLLLTGGTLSGQLNFTSASGTTITSTNGYFNNVYVNTTTQLATVSLQGVPTLDLFKVMSSTGAQLFAIKSNGQVVVGPNDLLQSGALTIQSQPGNDITLSFTDAISYTFQLGKVAGTSGRAFIGGPFGTAINLRAGGIDRVFISNDTGYVGINSSTPSSQLVVVGTSTFDGAILQTGLTDCDASNQTVAYDLTTGQFSCGTDDNNEQRVGTSTANYFTFYDTTTSVTGTSWVQFANGALTVTTNTNFTIVSSTNGLFGSVTTTNLAVTGALSLPNNSVTDAMIVAGLTISGGTIDNSPIGSSVPSTGVFTNLTSTNFFATNTVFINASTTNFYIAGILRDSTGSAGNFGDVLISTSTGNRWTNLGAACTPGSGDCTVVDNPSWFIVSGGAGCAENSIIIKDDSTYSCDGDFKWNRTDYATKRLEINGDISFLNATGTIGYFSESVSTTNIYADSITTNNITINNDVTVNNLIALESVTVAASTTITDAGVLTNAAIVKEYPANREGEFLTNVLTDPPSIVINTAVANTQAFYSDDLSRMLVCSNVTSTGAISLKNGTLTPVNTGNTAFYNNAGTLQTITANTLCGGATYAVRGCITTNGFHAVMCVATSTSPTVFVKVTTSSYTNDIANASNWRTANFTVATPTPSVIGMVGISRATGSNTRYLQFVSSTTKVVPATFDFTVNPPTITPDNTLTCTTGGSATIQNTRAYEGGLVVGNAGAPFVTVYSGCGGSTVNGSYGASAPSLTGPDLFVTRCSVYSLNGQSLFRQYGYNGCEKPEF